MYQIYTIPVTELEQNCRILLNESTKEAVIIDPGGESSKLLQKLNSLGVAKLDIVLTHSHFDHCGAVASIKKAYPNSMLYAHPIEKAFRSAVTMVAAKWGIAAEDIKDCPEPEIPLEGGEVVTLVGTEFTVYFTPGHSPGHLSFYDKQQNVLIAGDVIFRESIGRTDLPGGNHQQLLQSINRYVITLPAECKILCGHGPDTTVGHEKLHNPYL